MLHGSLIGQVTSTPQVLTSPGGLLFSIRAGRSVLDMLVTHELANKARRQLALDRSVFVQIGHVRGGLLVASAFDLVMPGTPSLNMFNVSGRVSGWPEERQGELRVRLRIEVADLPSTLALTAPQHLPWLGSLQLEHDVQVIGELRHVDGTLVIAATRVERLLST